MQDSIIEKYRKKLAMKIINSIDVGNVSNFEFWQGVLEKSVQGLNMGDISEHIEIDGEKELLRYFKQKSQGKKNVIFDVGANMGDYSKAVIEVFDGTEFEIHAFEPSAVTCNSFVNNINDERVILNKFGIGAESGEATLWSTGDNAGIASVFHRDLEWTSLKNDKTEKIVIKTLDEYCDENKIECIDFLKMDIEGNEYNALTGAKKLLGEKKIKAIQFEFGGASIDARVYLKDIWNLLVKDYHICRVMKDGIAEIYKYKELNEIFYTTNFFCYLR